MKKEFRPLETSSTVVEKRNLINSL